MFNYLHIFVVIQEYESDGIKECKRIQERLSEKGVSITIETLKRYYLRSALMTPLCPTCKSLALYLLALTTISNELRLQLSVEQILNI